MGAAEQAPDRRDTIFAASSGPPPAAIAVIRISGPGAAAALTALCGTLPTPRRATLRTLRDAAGDVLDRALVLWLPGPRSATGEDVAELHCHGGGAVIRAVETALAQAGLRRAEPGEFTRRAFVNGRLDLAQVDGLADLLVAETELQRRSAIASAGGVLSRTFEDWRLRLLDASAIIEALLDFADEDDVPAEIDQAHGIIAQLRTEIATWLARPHAETLREGVRVVLAGPPNAGKSTLFNALVGDEAAITAPTAGTTRDVLSRTIALAGVPLTLVDTAGLHAQPSDPVEAIGIDRARAAMEDADIVLWLGRIGQGPQDAWDIDTMIDRPDHKPKSAARHRISAVSGQGLALLSDDLVRTARSLLPKPGLAAINRRQREHLTAATDTLLDIGDLVDPLLIAEHLRLARRQVDALIGRDMPDDMLDALFSRFCIGK